MRNCSKKWSVFFMSNAKIFESLCRNANFYPFTPRVKAELSQYLGLSVRQVERLIVGQPKIHPCIIRLLEVRAKGLADMPEWQGFKIQSDMLVNPSGNYFYASDLRTWSLTKQRLAIDAPTDLNSQWALFN
jgi:hypothetical protein